MASFNLRTYAGSWDSQFTVESATTSLTFFLEPDEDSVLPPTIGEVRDKVIEILGYTETSVGPSGALRRRLPMCHPLWQNLTAYNVRVTPVEDQGDYDVEPADPEETLEAPVIHPDAVNWHAWRFDVSFAPKQYAMISDELMPSASDDWYDEELGLLAYTHYNEHLRFCEYLHESKAEYAKARQGQLALYTSAGRLTPFKDFPRILLPDSLLTIRWYMVPQRFILSANSNLEKYKGYINQKAFSIGGATYAPASMLYLNYKQRPYTYPFPELDEDWAGADVFSAEKLVDVDVMFALTRRTAIDPPTPSNPAYLAAGHNLAPLVTAGANSGGRGFYYMAAENDDEALRYPMFPSAPLELLFTDCDA